MAKILCLETSGEACSVALFDNGLMLGERIHTEQYSHVKVITILIQRLLLDCGVTMDQLDAVCVSNGPGSYTGLRVGSSVAKGICFGADIPLLSVDPLRAMAQASIKEDSTLDYYIPMIDARRMEVYAAIFDRNSTCIKATHSVLLDTSSWTEELDHGQKIAICGSGAKKFYDISKHPYLIFHKIELSARHLGKVASEKLRTGAVENTITYQPFYLKSPNITQSKKIY